MNTDKRKYDLIVSLGGNCTVAGQLRYRNLRQFSLPFDWVYMTDIKPIEYLCSGFSNGFKDFFLRESLEKVEGNETHKVVYKDTFSGYFFPNHFQKFIDQEDTYDTVSATLRRRIKRLLDKIETSENILFILATNFNFDPVVIDKLSATLTKKFPNKRIDFEVLQFSCSEETEKNKENIRLRTFVRSMNEYDFKQTNYEWAFMDNILLSKKRRQDFRCSTKLFGRNFILRLSWRKYHD